MKNKIRLTILAAVGAASLLGLAARAETSGAPMPANPASTPDLSAPATPAAAPADTNANPNTSMEALFGDPAVAKGTGFEIKQSRLDEVTAAVKANAEAHGQTVSDDDLAKVQAMALNEFIGTALLLQKATAADRADGNKQVDAAVQELVKQAGSMQALEMRLKGAGKTLDEYRSDLGDSMTANAVLIRLLNVSVSDADIKSFYDAHPTDFEQPEQVHVRHILFATLDLTSQQALSDDQKQAKLQLAQSVLKRLRAGEDFATLAKQYSEDPGSKENGGELPPFGHGEMVAEFDAAAFSLTNNQISDIVTSQYGYHIIQLLDRTPAQKISLAKVSDQVKAYLMRQKLAPIAPQYIIKLKQAGNVQILDDNLKAEIAALDVQATNPPPASVPAP